IVALSVALLKKFLCRKSVRHRVLISAYPGSNPGTPAIFRVFEALLASARKLAGVLTTPATAGLMSVYFVHIMLCCIRRTHAFASLLLPRYLK
ncbi:MAG: hypothetical protein KZQ58_04900, partial [gamma proteobacterium symbiont of Bathyaustriella thionipta]|nr:hypothetical protein [gamma proteobacterium symbiont of Bathyaustriella thionipta]